MSEDKDNLIRIKDLYKRSDEIEERLEKLEKNVSMKGYVDSRFNDHCDELKELEAHKEKHIQLIMELEQKLDSYITKNELYFSGLKGEVYTLSAVLKGFIRLGRANMFNDAEHLDEYYEEKELYDNLLKKLDGEPSGLIPDKEYDEFKIDDTNISDDLYNKEEYELDPNGYVLKEDYKRMKKGYKQAMTDLLNKIRELEVQNQKDIAEFLEDLKETIKDGKGDNIWEILINDKIEKWEGRRKE